MKRFTVLTLSIVILLTGSIASLPAISANSFGTHKYDRADMSSINPDQVEDSYYPIFLGISSIDDFTNIRERNNSLGEGAIVQVTEKTNVTFRYAVALQNTSSFSDTVNFQLYADLPEVNTTNFNNTGPNVPLSLTEPTDTIGLEYTGNNDTDFINYTHPYDDSVISNATLYYYETTVELNMSVSYLPFFVDDVTTEGMSERDASSAYNLLTTQQYFNTSSQDDFYIQNEIVNITGSLYFANPPTDTLGISYRINGGSERFENFTLVYTGDNGSASISLDDYSPGTEITWSSVFYTSNDTLINQSRIITGIDVKSVEVGDGTPELEVEVDPLHPDALIVDDTIYTQSLVINFSLTTTVPKGNISSVTLFGNETDLVGYSFEEINGTLSDVLLNHTVTYGGDGTYNATIETLTNKGLSLNKTYTVVIDRSVPQSLSLSTSDGQTSITTDDGEVSFVFSFEDAGDAGIKRAVLDLGNGESYEVTDTDNFNYRYEVFDGATYVITLTVVDKAGNLESINQVIELSAPEINNDRAPGFAILIFFVVLIALLSSPWWGPKAVELLRDRF